jgi:hypothetical protein
LSAWGWFREARNPPWLNPPFKLWKRAGERLASLRMSWPAMSNTCAPVRPSRRRAAEKKLAEQAKADKSKRLSRLA